MVAPGELEVEPLNETVNGASPDIGLAVNAAVGAGSDGNVTRGTARHWASATAVRMTFEPRKSPMIGVMTLNGVRTVTETFGGAPLEGYIAFLSQRAGATATLVLST